MENLSHNDIGAAEPVDNQEGASAVEQAAANKPAETAALDEATSKLDGSAAVAGEGVETETAGDVFFEGRKVVRVLPADQQGAAPKGFVRCEMSDATTVDVPEGLFSESDLEKAKEKSEAAAE